MREHRRPSSSPPPDVSITDLHNGRKAQLRSGGWYARRQSGWVECQTVPQTSPMNLFSLLRATPHNRSAALLSIFHRPTPPTGATKLHLTVTSPWTKSAALLSVHSIEGGYYCKEIKREKPSFSTTSCIHSFIHSFILFTLDLVKLNWIK